MANSSVTDNTFVNFADGIAKLTLEFDGTENWDSFTSIHVELYSTNDRTTPLQTSGYPSGEGDNDLYVPDTSSGVCYMKINESSWKDIEGALIWVVKAAKGAADSDFNDEVFNVGDKLKKLNVEGI